MIFSMTGFAAVADELPFGGLNLDLRSVNHRYLDIQFRLPEELRLLESALRERISAKISRGKVECRVGFSKLPNLSSSMQLDEALLSQLAQLDEKVHAKLPGIEALRVNDVLRWPGVVVESEMDAEPLIAAASDLLQKTLGSMSAMRASEGERIAAMIESRCADIAAISAGVRERMPEVLAGAHARQLERIEKLDVAADPARLEVELALLAQKLDVDEEVDRLDSHLTEIRQTLQSDEAVGRRLDFLMQELNREANTLGSKSADAQTTKAAVDLKVLIEQMREQIQNVE